MFKVIFQLVLTPRRFFASFPANVVFFVFFDRIEAREVRFDIADPPSESRYDFFEKKI